MKRNILVTVILTGLLSCTGCGHDVPHELPAPPIDYSVSTAAVTEAETAADSTDAAQAPEDGTEAAVQETQTQDVPEAETQAEPIQDPQSASQPGIVQQQTEQPETEKPTEAASQADFYAPPPPVYDIDGLTYITDPNTGVKVLLASKSYSMPENFAPGLEDVTYEYFLKMQEDAEAEGLYLQLSSGYRSYYDQVVVYNGYVNEVGYETADTFSARPGFSEHQTGLVIDLNSIDDSFGYTPEAAWVAEHAHEYGFIIRYPDGMESITGYKYEPWHIRYVGSEVATEIYNRQTCLETYLGLPASEYAEPYWG